MNQNINNECKSTLYLLSSQIFNFIRFSFRKINHKIKKNKDT